MPELILDITPRLNTAKAGQVASELRGIQDKVTQGIQGGTGAVEQNTKSQRELEQQLKRRIIVNENLFRQGKISQQQAVKNIEFIRRTQLAQKLLNQTNLKASQLDRTLIRSKIRLKAGFTSLATSSSVVNQSLINLGRIVQDLPFGFLGISNNIDPALNSLRSLRKEAGSNLGALKLLLKSLGGPGGLIFALGSLLPTALLVADRGFDFFAKKAEKAKDVVQEFITAASGLRDPGTFDFLNIRDTERQITTIEGLVNRLSKIDSLRRSLASSKPLNFGFASSGSLANTIEINEKIDILRGELGALADIDAPKLKEKLNQLNIELKIAKALFESDPLAKFKRSLTTATNNQLRAFQLGLGAGRKDLTDFRDGLVETANTLRAKFFLGDIGAATQLEIIKKLLKDVESELGDTKLKPLDFSDDLVAQVSTLEEEVFNEVVAGEDKIQAFREQARQVELEQRAAFFALLNSQLRFQKSEEERLEREAARKRIAIQRAVNDLVFTSSSELINALSQLNATRSDESEQQARKRFETQKKLSRAGAVVSTLEAFTVALADKEIPPFLREARAAAILASGLIKVAAINRQQFDGGGDAGGGVQQGFSTTSGGSNAPERVVNLPQSPKAQPIIINLSGEFDDELVSIKAEKGSDKRRQKTIFAT